MRKESNCSELEYLVMAMIATGVNSGYAMRKHMDRMRGGRWSTESGSIYRALKRLEADRFIEQKGKAGSPNRQRTEYRLTEAGQADFGLWMRNAMPADELERLDDPVRSRAYFLPLLTFAEREQVVKSWISGTKNLIEGIKYEIERRTGQEGPLEVFALDGYLAVAEARLDWLERLVPNLRLPGEK